jgi:hypothetical protein
MACGACWLVGARRSGLLLDARWRLKVLHVGAHNQCCVANALLHGTVACRLASTQTALSTRCPMPVV